MNKLFTAMVLFILSDTIVVLGQNQFTKYDTLRGKLNPMRTCMDVTFYDLSLQVYPDNKTIHGSNSIYYQSKSKHSVIQLELFHNLSLDSILWKKQKLSFHRDSNSFFVHFPVTIDSMSRNCITIFYHGQPIIAKKAPWDGGFVFTKDSLKRDWVGVACEGIGASLWWPLKDHLSDEPDSMRMTYTVPSDLMAVGNGNLISIKENPNRTTSYTWHVSYPINSYNVTFNAAHYTHIHDTLQQSNGILDLDYYILDYNHNKALRHFRQVKPMLVAYEHYYSTYPFPKDGYAMVETPYWGMEHQSCIAYGNDYTNYVLDFDYIIIHESGHEWWGNLVSTQDHGELWIHESFTTYTENLLIEYYYGYNASVQYLMFQRQRIKNLDPIVGPLDVNYEAWRGSDMYYKGAWMLHSLRNTIQNDSIWFSLLKAILVKYGYKTTNTKELIQFINEYTQADYTWFFSHYLYKAEPPILGYNVLNKKGRTYIQYRWLNTDSDFKLNLYFQDNNSFVTPTLNKQIIELPKTKKKRLQLWDTKSHYFKMMELVDF
jgi:aminopeptidase N